jgi:hypothetical protein
MMQIVVEGEAHSKSDYGDQQIAATFFWSWSEWSGSLQLRDPEQLRRSYRF